MTDARTKILSTLSERGYRITTARRELCRVLAAAPSPLTIQELAEQTKSDETSAYRFIRVLQEEQLVEVVTMRGERPRYAPRTHHHHHVVCTDCGFVAHVPCGTEPSLPRSVEQFAVIQDHDVTFYGQCTNCA